MNNDNVTISETIHWALSVLSRLGSLARIWLPAWSAQSFRLKLYRHQCTGIVYQGQVVFSLAYRLQTARSSIADSNPDLPDLGVYR